MDYKLSVFKEVALTGSFSKAAKRLHLSQPAVSKIIKNLEETYEKAFFERKANQIILSEDGKLFLEYAEKLLGVYQQLHDAFSSENQETLSEICIGASTTIANYILPTLIAILQRKNKELQVQLTIGNTNEIQELILTKQLDFGIVEGKNHNTRLHYEKFVQDQLVLVCKADMDPEASTILTQKRLKSMPLVHRELGSGSREVIEDALKKIGVEIYGKQPVFGSTESIKTYILHSDHYAFLSVHAISRELYQKQLKVLPVKDLKIYRWFYFITRQGEYSKRAAHLRKLLIKTYNQME